MKTLKSILNGTKFSFTFLSVCLVFASCDYVNNTVQPTAASNGGSNPSVIYKKVLVEDFTGHKCGNCPTAAAELKNLELTYAGKIIPVAVHAGYYAYTNATYTTNFQTTEGNDYDLQFGNSAAGNPNGLINRMGYGTAAFIRQWSSWNTEIAQQLNMPAKFQLKIKNNFNTTTKLLTTNITVKALDNLNGQYKLVVLLTEDSIVAEQLDYSKPSGSQFISNYEFNHVLRGSLNSSWGETLFNTTINANDSIIKTYSNYSVNTSYNSKKCHVVAYVYDANSSSPTFYEVMQAEEGHVE